MIRFTVYGKPEPQGSTRAFMKRGMRYPVITSDNSRLKPWRQEIAGVAIKFKERGMSGPVRVTLDFCLAKPKSAKKRIHPIVKPDLDKLCRSVLDAITGILIDDDSQVVQILAAKQYNEPERVEIEVEAL